MVGEAAGRDPRSAGTHLQDVVPEFVGQHVPEHEVTGHADIAGLLVQDDQAGWAALPVRPAGTTVTDGVPEFDATHAVRDARVQGGQELGHVAGAGWVHETGPGRLFGNPDALPARRWHRAAGHRRLVGTPPVRRIGAAGGPQRVRLGVQTPAHSPMVTHLPDRINRIPSRAAARRLLEQGGELA